MEQHSYKFNYSQDIVNLQTKYSLFRRVVNILFSVSFENGFDDSLMEKSIDLLIRRNDCLRLRFLKRNGETLQYFEEERHLGHIPAKVFSTHSSFERFLRTFRRRATDLFRGKALEAVFVTGPDGEKMVLFKICHLAADSYGIGVLVNDLVSIYKSLSDGTPLPQAPGSFEEILRKDNEYRSSDSSLERDRAFFKEYYEQKHSEAPRYCGLHGNYSDRWLRCKSKGSIALPYLFVRCDTEGYRFVLPASLTLKATEWCKSEGITLNAFFFYCCCVASSLRNDRAPHQAPLELLNCRGTLADRRAAGTKVQSLSVYATVDYTRSFRDNVREFFADLNELYKHTKLSYLEVEQMQHKLWGHSMMSQITGFSFSFIPMSLPEGVSMQLYSNGKGALAAYIALVHNIGSSEIYVNYDVQTRMTSPVQLVEFHNTYVHVTEAVLRDCDSALEAIL